MRAVKKEVVLSRVAVLLHMQAAVRRAMFESEYDKSECTVASVLCAVHVPLGTKRKDATSWSVVYAIVGEMPVGV